jgi:hypothetical protein
MQHHILGVLKIVQKLFLNNFWPKMHTKTSLAYRVGKRFHFRAKFGIINAVLYENSSFLKKFRAIGGSGPILEAEEAPC